MAQFSQLDNHEKARVRQAASELEDAMRRFRAARDRLIDWRDKWGELNAPDDILGIVSGLETAQGQAIAPGAPIHDSQNNRVSPTKLEWDQALTVINDVEALLTDAGTTATQSAGYRHNILKRYAD